MKKLRKLRKYFRLIGKLQEEIFFIEDRLDEMHFDFPSSNRTKYQWELECIEKALRKINSL